MEYCESCFRNATNYGEIYHGHFLILDTIPSPTYKIVREHEESVRFPSEPWKDPGYYLSTEEIWALPIEKQNRIDDYIEYLEKLTDNLRTDPHHGYNMINLCKKVGFNPDAEYLGIWLSERAAFMIMAKTIQEKL